MNEMLRAQVLLDLTRGPDGEQEEEDSNFFSWRDGEAPEVSVDLSNELFAELGSPSEITVTIEPGDMLNGDVQE